MICARGLGVGAAGFMAGLAAAYFLLMLPLDFTAGLAEARKLGIVSLTVLSGYSKSRDLANYLAVLLLPPLGAFLSWLVWARCRRSAIMVFHHAETVLPRKDMLWKAALIFAALVYAYACLSMTFIRMPTYNPPATSWIFLGEEGVHLACVQSIMRGGVYGLDFFSAYGPMLVYPLYWVMELFGTQASIARAYALFLNLAAYAIILFILYRTIGSRLLFLAAAAVYIAMYPPHRYFSLTGTHLRVALGILPLFLIHLRENSGRTLFLAGAGAIMGQALLFSQEAGLASALAAAAMFTVSLFQDRDTRVFFRDSACFAAGFSVSVAPMALFLASRGALSGAIGDMISYPRYMTLGFGNLPFPGFHEFLRDPLKTVYFLHYWIILVYSVSLAALLPRILRRGLGPAGKFRLILLVFGILLFRSDLGRSDLDHALFCAPPALLLVFLWSDGLLHRMRAADGASRLPHAALLGVSFLGLGLLLAFGIRQLTWKSLKSSLSWRGKFSVACQGLPAPSLPRAGVYFGGDAAQRLAELGRHLDANTVPGDYVYFFPNEAAFYFLFDRRNPTRYCVAYSAATSSRRKEVTDDLERRRPALVVYSPSARIDSIPEHVQVPEVERYLRENYAPVEAIGDTLILRRR